MPPLPLAQDQIIALESEVLDDCIALRSLPNDEAGVVCSHAFDAASNLYLHSIMFSLSSFRFVKDVCHQQLLLPGVP